MDDFGAYNVDICLCIDKTGSMQSIINTVKNNALNLYKDITEMLDKSQKTVNKLRIKVIWFGDYKADSEPMLISPFFVLPEETSQFETVVKSVNANGGGDAPEDALEALVYAMRSKWCKDGWKRRHIIAVFTDAAPHDIGFGKGAPTYPKSGMPNTFGELSQLWGDEDNPGEMDSKAKRLLLFAPDISYWTRIANEWENTVLRVSHESTGLKDVTYEAMLNTIVSSV